MTRPDPDSLRTATAQNPVPEIEELRIAVRKVRGKNRRSPHEVAASVMRLLELRSRLDRVAWNQCSQGSSGLCAHPNVKDWDVRHLFLVSIGIAFEDMPEVLAIALKGEHDNSGDNDLLMRATDAYRSLAIAHVPAAWHDGDHDDSNHENWRRRDQNAAMRKIWKALCDEIADIVRLPPRYGCPVMRT